MTVIGLEDGAVSGARFTEVADWLLVVDENQIALLDNKSLEWQLSGGLAEKPPQICLRFQKQSSGPSYMAQQIYCCTSVPGSSEYDERSDF